MRARRVLRLVGGPLAAAAVISACAPRADSAADRAAIARVGSEMLDLLNARAFDRWLSFVADSATLLPPGGRPVTGRRAIRAFLVETMADPRLSIVHRPATIEIARSRDLAVVRYAFDVSAAGDTAGAVRCNDLSVFVKGGDGRWRLRYDMWTSGSRSRSD